MSCEICGRSSCTRSFHSFDAQDRFDNPEDYKDEEDEYGQDKGGE